MISELSTDQIREQARPVLEKLRPGVVYLYGSHAEGRARADSDVDLGLVGEAPLDRMELLDAAAALADLLGREVDLVDLRIASPVLQVQVLSRGLRLFESNPLTRQRFEMQALSAYARLNESRKEILALYGR